MFKAKLSDSLYEEQLQRHHRRLFDSAKTKLSDVFVETSWNEIVKFLGKLQRLTDNPKEKFLIGEFIEYLELLNLVIDFREVRELDFDERDYHKLKRFIVFLRLKLSELNFRENSSTREKQQLWFSDIASDNMYVQYEEGLVFSILCGAGKSERAKQIRNFLAKNKSDFNKILDELYSELPSDIELRLPINAKFHLNRFQFAWLDWVGGSLSYPKQYDAFHRTITDPIMNSCEWITKQQIRERFGNEIMRRGNLEKDKEGLFPKYDAPKFLQFYYLVIEVKIPKQYLIGREPENLIEFIRPILMHLKTCMRKIGKALD